MGANQQSRSIWPEPRCDSKDNGGETMNDVIRGWWADALCNGDFILIGTRSGYTSGTRGDYKGAQIFLSVDVDDITLGKAVQDALAKSRWVLGIPRLGSVYHPYVEFDSDLYDYKKSAEHYVAWVSMLMERYGYKTKRALFKGMMSCSIDKKQGFIKVWPSHHVKTEAWEGTDAEPVVLPDTATAEEIGAALRLGFSRCTGI